MEQFPGVRIGILDFTGGINDQQWFVAGFEKRFEIMRSRADGNIQRRAQRSRAFAARNFGERGHVLTPQKYPKAAQNSKGRGKWILQEIKDLLKQTAVVRSKFNAHAKHIAYASPMKASRCAGVTAI